MPCGGSCSATSSEAGRGLLVADGTIRADVAVDLTGDGSNNAAGHSLGVEGGEGTCGGGEGGFGEGNAVADTTGKAAEMAVGLGRAT